MLRMLWSIGTGATALLVRTVACNAIVGIQQGLPLEEDNAATGTPGVPGGALFHGPCGNDCSPC